MNTNYQYKFNHISLIMNNMKKIFLGLIEKWCVMDL